MTVFFRTFGCKVNQCETNALAARFAAAGVPETDDPTRADIIVVNSCTVTASGDSRVLSAVRKLRGEAPNAFIVLTGCLPQTRPDIAALCPEADYICGTTERATLAQRVAEAMRHREKPQCVVAPHTDSMPFETLPQAPFGDKTRGFLKIQDGCDRFCSYCIIPYARGRSRSLPPDALRQEAERMAAAGHRELVLVGINLAFYGQDIGLRLADAVELCAGVTGISRIRLGSLEPEQLTDDDLARLAAIPQFCPQFHLSLQSGCDRTLKAMNRHYTSAEFEALTMRLRALFPTCALTTDVMVGFPGETAEDFADSVAFMQKIGFAKVHVFPYSPRVGTRAAARDDQLPARVKTQRAAEMTAAAEVGRLAFLNAQVGQTVPVLFERERDADWHRGHTPNFTPVRVPRTDAKKSLRKWIFRVIINGNDSDGCFGTLLPEEPQD